MQRYHSEFVKKRLGLHIGFRLELHLPFRHFPPVNMTLNQVISKFS